MAKLSAHGAELARATMEKETPDGELTTWERVERTFMADTMTLEKRTVRFRPVNSWDPPGGRLHTWGWKLRGKVKAGFTLDVWTESYRNRGWTVSRETAPTAIPLAA